MGAMGTQQGYDRNTTWVHQKQILHKKLLVPEAMLEDSDAYFEVFA